LSSSPRRFRFAPTPSRPLHAGSAVAGLFGWAAARLAGGTFILRVEDIDATRCRPEHEQTLLEDLRWLGLDWDEGPDVGGACGPYRQRERLDRHDAALAALARHAGPPGSASPLAYRCACSRADVQAARSAPHLAGPGGDSEQAYPGTCRAHPPDHLPEGRGGWRLAVERVPGGPVRSWVDGWCGPQREDLRESCGDFLLGRPGMPTYQLAVVVDDLAMGVTDVVRGRDLLGSTARQLALHAALGNLAPPAFRHHPLLLGADGRKLSKRDEAPPIAGLRAAGIAPERLIAALGRSVGMFRFEVQVATPADFRDALADAAPTVDARWETVT
jgi:glutamyl-tRNA synthetase